MTPEISYVALFFSAFISSTVFPGGSEISLVYFAREQGHALWLLITVASLGNTLGGMVTWGLGRIVAWKYPADKKLNKPKQKKAIQRLERWGSPMLLLSWLPVIGDPLCLAAGWLRIHWLASLVFIAIGKTLRYIVLILVVA